MKARAKIKAVEEAHEHRHGHHHEGHSHATAKLGPNEQIVEKILAKAPRPLSAYDIIPLMSKQTGNQIAPATVYRALQHLTEQGLVTRIESRNAYTLCTHASEDHDCLFFICRQCGKATEAPDSRISELIRLEAQILRFGVKKQVMEVVGLCRECGEA